MCFPSCSSWRPRRTTPWLSLPEAIEWMTWHLMERAIGKIQEQLNGMEENVKGLSIRRDQYQLYVEQLNRQIPEAQMRLEEARRWTVKHGWVVD